MFDDEERPDLDEYDIVDAVYFVFPADGIGVSAYSQVVKTAARLNTAKLLSYGSADAGANEQQYFSPTQHEMRLWQLTGSQAGDLYVAGACMAAVLQVVATTIIQLSAGAAKGSPSIMAQHMQKAIKDNTEITELFSEVDLG